VAKEKEKKTGAPHPVASAPEPRGISAISVAGFKSIRKRTEIAIRPLTILAGANSSGKSSIMQPVLLMKQTLEAPYDPGALLLDGTNVRFTSAEQLLARRDGKAATHLSFGVTTSDEASVVVQLKRRTEGGFEVTQMTQRRAGAPDVVLRPGVTLHPGAHRGDQEAGTEVRRERCFLVQVDLGVPSGVPDDEGMMADGFRYPGPRARTHLLAALHVPALRGNPERTYKTTAVGDDFPGTFEPYVASIVHHWQVTRDLRLKHLAAALRKLGLNWKIEASRVDDTRVELRVGRLKQETAGGARDMVSIADVGFGVRQCLPVLVAVLTARPGQLVYIEEPEIHLHPRAQVALAQILADAANRGVRVIIETHSSLLLLGVQALVAEGALPPERVALHWFSLTQEGVTEVRSADLDEAGAFGDWPEDFDEVALDVQARYLDAAEKRLAQARR
jgi:predicted ATPase